MLASRNTKNEFRSAFWRNLDDISRHIYLVLIWWWTQHPIEGGRHGGKTSHNNEFSDSKNGISIYFPCSHLSKHKNKTDPKSGPFNVISFFSVLLDAVSGIQSCWGKRWGYVFIYNYTCAADHDPQTPNAFVWMYTAVYVHTIRKCTLVLVLPNSASILVTELVTLVPLYVHYLSTRLQAAFMRPSPPMCVCERVCMHVYVYVCVFCVCDSSSWSVGWLSSQTDRDIHTGTETETDKQRETKIRLSNLTWPSHVTYTNESWPIKMSHGTQTMNHGTHQWDPQRQVDRMLDAFVTLKNWTLWQIFIERCSVHDPVCLHIFQSICVCTSVCLYLSRISHSHTRYTPASSKLVRAPHVSSHYNTLHYTATHCNTLYHTATHCNTLQHVAPRCTTV